MKSSDWRHHSYAKDIYAVKRAEQGLKKKGWEVKAQRFGTTTWEIFIRWSGEE